MDGDRWKLADGARDAIEQKRERGATVASWSTNGALHLELPSESLTRSFRSKCTMLRAAIPE